MVNSDQKQLQFFQIVLNLNQITHFRAFLLDETYFSRK